MYENEDLKTKYKKPPVFNCDTWLFLLNLIIVFREWYTYVGVLETTKSSQTYTPF